MSKFLKSFSSIGKSQERSTNQNKQSSKGPMKKLFQKKHASYFVENSIDQKQPN